MQSPSSKLYKSRLKVYDYALSAQSRFVLVIPSDVTFQLSNRDSCHSHILNNTIWFALVAMEDTAMGSTYPTFINI